MLLFLGLIFGAVGGVYIFFGRQRHSASYLVCGVLLILYPYFVESAWLMILVGVTLALIPHAIEREWF